MDSRDFFFSFNIFAIAYELDRKWDKSGNAHIATPARGNKRNLRVCRRWFIDE